MDWSGPWWLGILAVGIALLIGTAIYIRRQRRSGLQAAAEQFGFKPYRGPNPFSPAERKGVNLFSRGYGGKRRNVAADNLDVPSTFLFDFTYRFGLRVIASVSYSQSVAAFSARMTSLPNFQLTPAALPDRLAPKLGLQAIRFDSRPEFNKKHWLRSKDEILVKVLFTDALLDALMGFDQQTRWSVEKSGGWLFVYRHGMLSAPQGLRDFWSSARAIADIFIRPH
jgi:hypothetical protein